MADSAADEAPSGVVNDVVASAVLGYVEEALGRQGLEQIVELMPGVSSVNEMMRGSKWWKSDEFAQLVEAAMQITGESEIGRRIGEQMVRTLLGGPLGDLIKETGSTEAALATMADYSSRMTDGRVVTVVESSPNHVLMEGNFTNDVGATSFACEFGAGYFGALPMLFDQLGTCVETTCQVRGDDLCRYRVAWRPDPRRSESKVEDLDRVIRGSSALDELERTHRLAARLVESHEIAEVLERVVNSISGVIGAPQHVLFVRLDDGEGRRVHQVGFEGDGAERLADRVEAGDDMGDNILVTEIKHGDRSFGQIVTVLLPQAKPAVSDQRILSSYAQFAGAAIQIVEALGAARRDRDAATAMLSLATALAETSGVQSVIENLCTALPAATGCDVGAVWLYDADAGEVELVAATDRFAQPLPIDSPAARFDPRSLPGSGAPLVGPMVVDLDHPEHRLQLAGDYPFVQSALVPIGTADNLVAVASAIFERRLTLAEHRDIGDRLNGLAHQALVAFENARLIEETRHQALHDDLTGLPKRMLAEDRCRQALARRQRTGEEVALLFIDVDDFKAVNDTFGHAAGDELLQGVAQRLSSELRASDTCARVGGDEFVVILTGAAGSSSGVEVAERLARALDEPFIIGDDSLSVTASIGLAWAGPGAEEYHQLVAQADAAMYQAKAGGKARLVRSV